MTDRQMDDVPLYILYILFILFTFCFLAIVTVACTTIVVDVIAANEACKGHGGVRSSTDTSTTVICNDGLATNKKWD